MLADSKFRYVNFCIGGNNRRIRMLFDDIISKVNEAEKPENWFATINYYANPTEQDDEFELMPFFFDLDDVDLEKSKKDALTIISFMNEAFSIDEPGAIKIFFSGKKGFHILIDHRIFGIKPKKELNKIMKRAALYLKHKLNLETLDERVYTNNRLFRLPNTIHGQSGLYCIPLYENELMGDIESIKKIAESSRHEEELEDVPISISPNGKEWFDKFVDDYEKEMEAKQLVGGMLDISIDGDPICVRDLEANGLRRSATRNDAQLCLLYYYKIKGLKESEALERITEWALRQDLSDSSDQEREIQAKANTSYVYGKKSCYFSCSVIKRLGFDTDKPIACDGPECKYMALEDQVPKENIRITLRKANDAAYIGQRVNYDGHISYTEEQPTVVPCTINMFCTPDLRTVNCKRCPHSGSGSSTYTFNAKDRKILYIVQDKKSDYIVFKNSMGIPSACKICSFKVETNMNIVSGLVSQPISRSGVTDIDVFETKENQVFFIGKDLVKDNKTYSLSGYTHRNPVGNKACQIIDRAESIRDLHTQFKMTSEKMNMLKKFQPEDDSYKALVEKYKEIRKDQRDNVHHIIAREDMWSVMDIVIHSCLEFRFKGIKKKGWMDAMIIGDTGHGKTEMIKSLIQFYGVGSIIPSESLTEAGLKGSTQRGITEDYRVKYGVFPQHDNGLLVLDECHEAIDTISKLTQVRSDGIVKIVKAAHGEARSRVRVIFTSNPPHGTRVDQHEFPVKMISQIFKGPEDIRRLDLAIVVADRDVPLEKRFNIEKQTFSPYYTSSECIELINFIWSRTDNQIVFDKDVEEYIFLKSQELIALYSADIPLVDKGDIPFKIARGAISIAGRTFSVDKHGRRIFVQLRHVQLYLELLERLYGNKGMRYKQYSLDKKTISQFSSEEEKENIKDIIKKCTGERGWYVVRYLSRRELFSVHDITVLFKNNMQKINDFMSILLDEYLIEDRGKMHFRKTAKGVMVMSELREDPHGWGSYGLEEQIKNIINKSNNEKNIEKDDF